MNEVTLRGFVGDDPSTKTVGEHRVGEFRLGLSSGHVDQQTGERVQHETTWLTVSAWNGVLHAAPGWLAKRDYVHSTVAPTSPGCWPTPRPSCPSCTGRGWGWWP